MTIRRVIAGAIVVLALTTAAPSARANLRAGQWCEGQSYLPFLECVSSGLRWTITGGPGDDVLTGTWADDVIHSGRGQDVVDGRGGTDTCYVQPADVVRHCEELVGNG